MAEADQQAQQLEQEDDDHGDNPDYKPPAEKSLSEIISADAEDESLRRYKETLLGKQATGFKKPFPDDNRNVIVTKMCIVVEGRDDIEMDLLNADKKLSCVIKEGTSYRIRVVFYVQEEIVPGLKYIHKVKRKGVPVDKATHMVGSYGPKAEAQFYLSPYDETPTGLIARGTYTITSQFTDDDKKKYLEWEWKLEVKKDWE